MVSKTTTMIPTIDYDDHVQWIENLIRTPKTSLWFLVPTNNLVRRVFEL
jgi:hypothetical protein